MACMYVVCIFRVWHSVVTALPMPVSRNHSGDNRNNMLHYLESSQSANTVHAYGVCTTNGSRLQVDS